jgi:hypothetical protein
MLKSRSKPWGAGAAEIEKLWKRKEVFDRAFS